MTERVPAEGRSYELRLFVAGDEQRSQAARENLTRICDSYLKGRCNLKIVDVMQDFKAALDDNVLVTPTLIVVSPEPRATILGSLSDQSKVLRALHLEGGL